MNKRLQTALCQAAISTFESMGFLLPTRELDERQLKAPAEGAVCVQFHGPVSGILQLRTFGKLLPVLTANMMGLMEPPSPQLQQDALGELANVICGHIVSHLADPGAAYSLDSPEIMKTPAPPASEEGTLEAQVQLGIEDGRTMIELRICEGSLAP
jgi:CheY-specific phosphatase CheX